MLLWSCLHMSWWLLLIIFSWASIQRLPLLSLQEACSLFWYFLWAVCMDTSSVSEHKMQSPEAVSMSELSTFSLDDSGSEEAWSLVLFELPATVPSSRSTVVLVGLEEHPCSKLGLASGTNLAMFFITLSRAVFTPSLNLWGANLSPFVTMIAKWTAGRVVPLLWGRTGNEPRKWAPHWGSAYKWKCLTRGILEKEEFQFDELDCLRDLEPVIPLAWVL